MVKESRPRMAIRSNQSVRSRSTRQLRSKTNHCSPENQGMGVGLARVIHSFARCSALLLVIGTLVDVSAVNGTHYRGGTISWSPAPPSTSSNRTVRSLINLGYSTIGYKMEIKHKVSRIFYNRVFDNSQRYFRVVRIRL